MIQYLKLGELPDDEKQARKTVLESANVLHFDHLSWKVLCGSPRVIACLYILVLVVIFPKGRFKEVCMVERDVRRFCRGCLTCTTRKGRQKTF